MPAQPPPKARNPNPSTAEENTKKLERAERRQARAALDEEVQKFDADFEERVAEVATRLHLDPEEVRKALGHVSKWKERRGYNVFNAKVWRRGEELNAGKSYIFCVILC